MPFQRSGRRLARDASPGHHDHVRLRRGRARATTATAGRARSAARRGTRARSRATSTTRSCAASAATRLLTVGPPLLSRRSSCRWRSSSTSSFAFLLFVLVMAYALLVVPHLRQPRPARGARRSTALEAASRLRLRSACGLGDSRGGAGERRGGRGGAARARVALVPSRRSGTGRALDADDRRRARRRLPRDGRGDSREVVLALPDRLRPAPRADALDLPRECARVGDRARGVSGGAAPGGSPTPPNASSTLPVAVAWATLGRPSCATLWTDEGLLDEVDGDRLVAPGDRERRGLAHSPRRAARSCGRASSRRSSRSSDRVAELDEAEPQPVAAVSPPGRRSRPTASVARRRETVLALTPVRRAISFVPSSPPSASASSTASAR